MAKNASNKIQLQLSPDMREQDKDIAAFLAASTERNTNIMRDALTAYMALSAIDPRLPRTLAGAYYEGIPAVSILNHVNNMAELNGVNGDAITVKSLPSQKFNHPAIEVKKEPEPQPMPIHEPEQSNAQSNELDVQDCSINVQRATVKSAVRSRHKPV